MKGQPVRRIWSGRAFVLASGPSLTQSDVDAVRSKGRVIAVNDCWRLAPWADVLYACDQKFWDEHCGVPAFAGQKWTQCELSEKRWGLNRVSGLDRPGLSFDPEWIHYGANSGYQALNLAVLLGVTQIVLLGFDMQAADGKRHWFGDHPEGMNNPTEDSFARWCAAFDTIPASIKGTEIEIINCSRDTALTCFPRADLAQFLGNQC